MSETVKLYERVERKYRPDSHRYRAEVAEDENTPGTGRKEQAARDRNRIAELERQLEERGPRRHRRRRNNPPRSNPKAGPEGLLQSNHSSPTHWTEIKHSGLLTVGGRGRDRLPGRMEGGPHRRMDHLRCRNRSSSSPLYSRSS